MRWKPSRIRSWSSAMRMRADPSCVLVRASHSTAHFLPDRRQVDLSQHRRTGSRSAADVKVTAEQGDPLVHARDPHPLPRTVPTFHLNTVEATPPVPHL